MLFDSVTVGIFALLAGCIGYAIGGIRASLAKEATTVIRPLSRQERDEVVALLAAGETTTAIRRVRELTGSDLAAAHSAVTRLQHELDPRLIPEGREGNASRLRVVILSLALATAHTAPFAQEVAATSIGHVRATFAEPFSRVAAVREEPDGRVLVLDDIENRILRVDLRTASAIALGRMGSGPGEYTLPLSLLPLAADTTLAVDMSGGGRALVIVARGVETARLRAAGVSQDAPLFFRPDVQSDARGNLYELVILTSPADREAGNSGIRRLDRFNGRQDTIGRVSQRLRSPLARPIAQRPSGSTEPSVRRPTPPFPTTDQWAVAPDGRIAIVTVEPYRVHFIEPSGRRLEGPQLLYSRVPVTAAHKAEWRALQEQPVATLQYGPGGAITAGRTRRTYQEPSEWPDVLPPFLQRALRFAPDGMLWVERAGPAGAGQTFDVIDVRGNIVRRVTLPPRLRLVGFGREGIYTVRRDEDDLEFLQLHHAQP